ncbi:hypothetical protein PGTUg99_034784 [Puccinia graminis f. sp. tritici]|uniref:Prephenate dehydratase domain-containing protein n=1 Tax=Puccinia graminis f. sp. tritici TaxID=56615 RepID=A0A5B0QT23_PUCGR|nr:hypothetical protein PGTUg99_034784 [Puccinia graminis f. sp. tritici]
MTLVKLPGSTAGSESNRRARVAFLGPIGTYSHEALGQCQQYLATHYPDVETRATSSTAEAATLVANDPSRSSLAICAASCVEYFPLLEVLDANIQDAGQDNITTFIVLGSKD